MIRRRSFVAALGVIGGLVSSARAEVGEVVFAREYGLQFLPTMIMERDHLVEKHAALDGIADLKVRWASFGGPTVINDGLISGSVHFGTFGSVPLITLWSKTRNGAGVMGVAPMATFPVYLNTRDPKVLAVKDLGERNRIAVPSIKISAQALLLEMAAVETWGSDALTRLDPLTVSMSHPDAVVAMSTDKGSVDTHFTSPPFHEQEMRLLGVHTITTNTEILGGPATAVVLASTQKFRAANPTVYRAVRAGAAREHQHHQPRQARCGAGVFGCDRRKAEHAGRGDRDHQRARLHVHHQAAEIRADGRLHGEAATDPLSAGILEGLVLSRDE